MSCVEVSFPKEKPIASGMALCLGFISGDLDTWVNHFGGKLNLR
jgi:hypothetical protein